MISWHKPGQRIACVFPSFSFSLDDTPDRVVIAVGDEFTIASVMPFEVPKLGERIGFTLEERPDDEWFSATLFAPIYPQIIDQLRKLDAPSPNLELERVKEGV